ncbi:MAG TPA: LysR family transcriptional regulator [Gammaproteobacteria bacterium]|nr:LysR family transcriptional regulator [Gammaproteobacteria bacterium]
MSTIDPSQLRHLAVFAAVVDAGSFAAAARLLHTSRSRVSEQVAQLERALGVRLLQRSTRRLKLTAEGAQVHVHARQLPGILQAVDAVTQPAVPRGRVALTLNHDIAHKFLLPALPAFRRRYPEIQLDLMLNDERLDLIARQIDLGIRIGIPRDDSLIARVLHEERFGVFASAAYLAEHGTPDSVDALTACHWVILSQANEDRPLTLQRGDTIVKLRPPQAYRCDSPMLMQQMVIQGMGVGALLPCTVRAEVARGDLVQLLPDLRGERLAFALVYPSRRQLPLRTRVLIDYLVSARLFASDPR